MDKREERKLKKLKKRQEKIAHAKLHQKVTSVQQKRALYDIGRMVVMVIVGVILGMVILLNVLK